MKKRILSLLCVLALCLGLLPVTALAAGETAPATLYVGSTPITSDGYWITSDGGTTWTYQSSMPSEGGYIHYDGNGTLTLHNVTITGTSSNSESLGAGIYAVSRANSDVALTINLDETSTVSGDYGVCVQANQVPSSAGNSASLTISGDGTLTAIGNSSYGIAVVGYNGGAALTIENATVNASTSGTLAAGVFVSSGSEASESPEISLAVNGGSLTASGGSGSSKGIWFCVGLPSATGAATSLTVGENAIVDAKTGGISATRDMSQFDPTISTADSNGGIVWNGKDGTVYGEVTLQDELTIESGETLTIGKDASLTVPDGKTLTNNGTILVESGGKLEGTVTPPTISKHPESKSVVSLQSVTFSVEATASDGDLTYQWQQSTDGGSSWKAISNATSTTYNVSVATSGMNGYQYRCVVTADGVSVISDPATLTVMEPAVDRPSITTESLSSGTVGTAYNQALQADNAPIQWSVTSGSLPAGLSLGADGTISGTPTTAGTFDFTVTATNSAGSDSKEYTIQIAAKSDTTPPVLTAGTVNRTSDKDATVTFTSDEAGTYFYKVVDSGAGEPTDITSGTSYTLTSDTNTITLTDLTAGAKDIYIVAKDASDNQSATLKMEIPAYVEPVYSISANTTVLDFGSAYTGYTQPAAQTVTITNTGNQPLTLTQPASTNSFEVGTLSKTVLAAGETATITVQPKAGLAAGAYSEDITVSSSQSATVTISASFTVKQYSSGGGSSSSSSVSDQTVDKIEAAKDGSTVEITLRTGQTTLDKEVFEELSGKDVTLVIKLPSGVTWTVNGQDIPENAKLSDLDLGVTLDASTIPASVINAITGAVDTIQLSLKHDGAFGFTMTLSAPLGTENKGLWANLYYYNEDSRELEFQAADKIASDGTAEFPFDHASQYVIVIDTDSHEQVELPFTDVPEGAWYADAAAYVYKHGLMAGTSATTFAPDVTTSRAMIATILWRMAGSPVVNYAMTYTDVAQGQWYSEAVRWATSEGVVTGYGNGLFGTNDPITREQFAAMLWRYAQTEDYDVSVGEDTNILSYTDAFDVAEYAIPAMQWAVGAGIINGTGDGSTLTPQGQATRAQAAVMLMRFCEEYVIW